MPVIFRGVSEYSSTYKWNPSYRSAEFKPSPNQTVPEAGLRSDQLNLLVEPSFTKKRQVPHRRPETQQCLMWWQDDDFGDGVDEVSLETSSNAGIKGGLKTFVVKPSKAKVLEKEVKVEEKTIKKESPKRKIVEAEPVKNVSKSTWEKDLQTTQFHKEQKKTELLKSQQSPKKTSPLKAKKQVSKHKDASPSPAKSKKSPKKDAKSRHVPLQYRSLQQRYLSAHQSEYQNMYRKPTKFIPSSPLISALDVVHSSSPAILPHKSPKMFSKSEYSSMYKTQSPLKKSITSFTSPASPSLKMKVRDISSPPRHTHSSNAFRSEYTKQFPEKQFPVEYQGKIQEEASHNKLNREGSAFDKDHVNQIYSPNNKLWDTSSYVSSTVVPAEKESDAKELEKSERYVRNLVPTQDTEPEADNEKSKQKGAEDVEIETIEADFEKDSLDAKSTTSTDTLIGSNPVARKLAWGESDNGEECDDSSTVASTLGSKSSESYGGRLPTPQLKSIGGAARTHHDITTPCGGGALLTSPTNSTKLLRELKSPPKPTSPPKKDINFDAQDHIKKSNIPSTPCRKPKVDEEPDSKPNKQDSPFMKTRVIRKAPTPSPNLPRRMHRVIRAPIQGALRSQEFQHCGRNSRPTSTTDFDRMSMASVASVEDLYQRSLQRKDFWKK